MSRTTLSHDPNVEERLKSVVKRVFDLPSFPLVVRRLMEVAENPRSSSKDMAQVMESDQGLSAKILKLANSAFYGFPRAVKSLQHAITLLGYNSVRSLALSVSVKGLFKNTDGAFSQERFWEHSLAAALGARLVGELNRYPLKDDLFTAGLLHDVGILIEARYFPEELERSVKAVHAENIDQSTAEERFVGVDHCLLGAWLAEQWQLPPDLREPMLRHRQLETRADAILGLDEGIATICEYVALGNMLANGMGYRHNRLDSGPPEICTDFPIPEHLKRHLGDHPLETVVQKLAETFEASRAFLDI